MAQQSVSALLTSLSGNLWTYVVKPEGLRKMSVCGGDVGPKSCKQGVLSWGRHFHLKFGKMFLFISKTNMALPQNEKESPASQIKHTASKVLALRTAVWELLRFIDLKNKLIRWQLFEHLLRARHES